MDDYALNPGQIFRKNHGMCDDDLYHKYIVICPVCGFEYNKVEELFLEKGNDNYESSAPVYRGNLVKILFTCENDHQWELCFGFHKGNTFAFFRNIHALSLK